jgi:hypothetical protein
MAHPELESSLAKQLHEAACNGLIHTCWWRDLSVRRAGQLQQTVWMLELSVLGAVAMSDMHMS